MGGVTEETKKIENNRNEGGKKTKERVNVDSSDYIRLYCTVPAPAFWECIGYSSLIRPVSCVAHTRLHASFSSKGYVDNRKTIKKEGTAIILCVVVSVRRWAISKNSVS